MTNRSQLLSPVTHPSQTYHTLCFPQPVTMACVVKCVAKCLSLPNKSLSISRFVLFTVFPPHWIQKNWKTKAKWGSVVLVYLYGVWVTKSPPTSLPSLWQKVRWKSNKAESKKKVPQVAGVYRQFNLSLLYQRKGQSGAESRRWLTKIPKSQMPLLKNMFQQQNSLCVRRTYGCHRFQVNGVIILNWKDFALIKVRDSYRQ